MPKYGLHKYGRFQYGKYNLTGGGGSDGFELGPHVRYRIRTRSPKGDISEFLTMYQDRLSIQSKYIPKIRIRASNGEWVYPQSLSIAKEVSAVRIRSIESDGGTTEWVYSNRGSLK